ncbi:MAG: hypothetical protein ACFFGP_15850 [Promethearchaeota archaeon]
MLPRNIETEVKEILQKHDGWLRVEECARAYAKGNGSKRTKFYRWRRQVEKGKVEGFQILKFLNNVVYIGLKSADPNRVHEENLLTEKPSEKNDLGKAPVESRMVWCNQAIRREENLLDDNDPQYYKKLNKIQTKYRKEYGLI